MVSVYLTGRRLDRLPVRAGQFLTVRFLDGPGWSRANPFSLSAAPDGRSLRITAKALGRRQRAAGSPAAGHPGAVRGPVRSAQQPGPDPADGAAGGRRGRDHPVAGPGRGTGVRARRRRAARPVHRRTAVRRRAAGPGRGAGTPGHRSAGSPSPARLRPGSGGRRRRAAPRCCAGSPIWPSATSSSAGRQPGPPASHVSWSPPAYLVPASTPRALVGEPVKRIVIWLASTVTIVVLLFGYHTSTNSATPASASGGIATAPSSSATGAAAPPDPSSDPTAGRRARPARAARRAGAVPRRPRPTPGTWRRRGGDRSRWRSP